MDEIEIVPYDSHWPALFRDEAAHLRDLLPPHLILGLEHFGSTAIPGLAAKPIIDILVAVPSLRDACTHFVEPMAALGYAFWDENPKTDRLFFVKGLPPASPRRTHHVHVTEPAGELWQRLAFRDHLRADPAEAQLYERLKKDLAVKYRNDREAYTAAREDYLRAIMAKVSLRTISQ